MTKFDKNLTRWRGFTGPYPPDCDVIKTLIFNISRTTNATKVVDPSFEPKFDNASYETEILNAKNLKNLILGTLV